MKNGTFIIIEKEGKFVVAIQRADGGVVELPEIAVTPDLQKLNGQPCEYLLKGDKIVKVGGRNIFQQQKQEVALPATAKKPVATDWRRDLRAMAANDKPEIIEEMGKPAWSRNDSFSLQQTRVPNDTRQLTLAANSIDNFDLKLNRLARFEQQFNDRKNEWDRKFVFFMGKQFAIQPNFGSIFSRPNQVSEKNKQAAQSVFSSEGQLLSPKFKPDWRFVTGLGGHSVYETGITLHHVYGIPYIPASSVKGVLRAWLIANQFENNEGTAISTSKEFCHLFGCPPQLVVEKEGKKKTYDSVLGTAHQGKVSFFDALPTHSPNIEPDIMNPHYPKWYSGKKGEAPVDTDSPNPVFFLTVVDTTFQFLIGSKKWNLISELFWGKTLERWLEEALSEKGIGAKTAVGYGYMKPV